MIGSATMTDCLFANMGAVLQGFMFLMGSLTMNGCTVANSTAVEVLARPLSLSR